jgi:competence ComEA-like helix-hairpin-helix protein
MSNKEGCVNRCDIERSFSVAVFLCVCLSVPFCVDFFTSENGAYEVEPEGRINPNFAPEASLVRLPGIGAGRAGAIVGFRDNFRKEHGEVIVFRTVEDLCNVQGIGPATAEKVSEYLRFD